MRTFFGLVAQFVVLIVALCLALAIVEAAWAIPPLGLVLLFAIVAKTTRR